MYKFSEAKNIWHLDKNTFLFIAYSVIYFLFMTYKGPPYSPPPIRDLLIAAPPPLFNVESVATFGVLPMVPLAILPLVPLVAIGDQEP